jgi:hypothetical protein
MAVRIFLAVCTLAWLPYGIFCFLQPGLLAESAGVAATTPTGSTELRAMYGGLQAALGVLALAGALRASLARPALVALFAVASGLLLTRAAGLVLDGGFSAYTGGALAFEASMAGFAAWLLSRPTQVAR